MAPIGRQQYHFCRTGILLILILMLRESLAVAKSPSATKQEADHKSDSTPRRFHGPSSRIVVDENNYRSPQQATVDFYLHTHTHLQAFYTTFSNQITDFPEEDSDMLMEPNEFPPINVQHSHEQQHYHMQPTTQLSEHQPQHLQLQRAASVVLASQSRLSQAAVALKQQKKFRPIAKPNTLLTSRADVSDSQAAQNYYPPFFHETPPLGHSRPYFARPASPVSASSPLQLPLLSTTQQQQHQLQQRGFDATILGSGDFGVLRGGTFYPEEEMPYHPEDNRDYSYGDANNGHGRPSEAFIQKYTYPEEQFANFRDFADISTPADSAFSQFVVVYAAKNATKASLFLHPKNIFEQLELLDRERELAEAAPKKQQPSKSKTKLSKTKLQKKYKKIISQELEVEPLLALS